MFLLLFTMIVQQVTGLKKKNFSWRHCIDKGRSSGILYFMINANTGCTFSIFSACVIFIESHLNTQYLTANISNLHILDKCKFNKRRAQTSSPEPQWGLNPFFFFSK